MLKPYKERPYRPCVGMMIFNKNRKIFCGQRIDNINQAWQLPQGGIDGGENPIDAAFREIKEETSMINVNFVADYPSWINYDVPVNLANKLWGGAYRGQTQKWLLFFFHGPNSEISVQTSHPEFRNWQWLNIEELTEKAIYFKKRVYRKINKSFHPLIKNYTI